MPRTTITIPEMQKIITLGCSSASLRPAELWHRQLALAEGQTCFEARRGHSSRRHKLLAHKQKTGTFIGKIQERESKLPIFSTC